MHVSVPLIHVLIVGRCQDLRVDIPKPEKVSTWSHGHDNANGKMNKEVSLLQFTAHRTQCPLKNT